MLDQTLLMQTLQDIANTGERLSNEAEMNAFKVIAEAFEKVGAKVEIEDVPLFVSTVDRVSLKADGQHIDALGNAMTLPLCGDSCRQGTVSVQGHLRIVSAQDWISYTKHFDDEIILLTGLANLNDLRKAQNLGVSAVIFDTGERIHRMIVSDVWGSPTPGCEKRYVNMPNACIKHSDALSLESGMAISLELTINSRWTTSPVLMAQIKHTDPTVKAFTAIVTAHIDSWGAGALDNASGIATMVASAKEINGLKNRPNDVCYVVWSGHSHGRYAGSTAWFDKHFSWLNDNVFVNLNCDCLGAQGSTILGKTPVMASTKALALKAHEDFNITEQFTQFNRSCDQSFMCIGIPSVFSNISEVPPTDGVSMKVAGLAGVYGPYWHSTDDTLKGINPIALERDAVIFTKGLIHAINLGPSCLDLRAEWQEFSHSIVTKLETILSSDFQDPISESFKTEPVWNELQGKITEIESYLKEVEKHDAASRLKALKQIVAIAYSAAPAGLQDPAGQSATCLFNKAYDSWRGADPQSFGFYSAWTALVRGANQLMARLNSLQN